MSPYVLFLIILRISSALGFSPLSAAGAGAGASATGSAGAGAVAGAQQDISNYQSFNEVPLKKGGIVGLYI